jgi:maltose/moltooligosaccharide transporter
MPTSPSPSVPAGKSFKVGTLTYTKAGLFSLFAWLLWGDFCFILMETAAPSVLQVNLNEMGAPNWMIGLILSTIPGVLNMTVCPAASFWSDRFRSRWGRRIPFLFIATIPLTVFLALIGFSRQIGAGLHALAQPGGFSVTAVTLGVIVFLVFGFQLFNMVVASVYYYLFNDVVPTEVLSRFMSLFRVVGVLSSAAFNWFFLKHAVSHMTEVYLIAAGLYCAAFLFMCWRVKEGEYPPPPAQPGGGAGLSGGIKTFFIECYSQGFYWLFFLANTFYAVFCLVGAFLILQARSIGVDLDFYGKTVAVASVVSAVLMYPAGILADRFHPLRVLIGATLAMLLIQPLWLAFVFFEFGPAASHTLFVVITAITIPANTLYFAAELPMYMRILPKERYGQFSSANAMVRSVAVILGGVILGLSLDRISVFFPARDFAYRFLPVWAILSLAGSLFLLLKLHAAWKKQGGPLSYTPPKI